MELLLLALLGAVAMGKPSGASSRANGPFAKRANVPTSAPGPSSDAISDDDVRAIVTAAIARETDQSILRELAARLKAAGWQEASAVDARLVSLAQPQNAFGGAIAATPQAGQKGTRVGIDLNQAQPAQFMAVRAT